ncbi:uncharacterized protein PV09_07567 [Verruconis gallopava]|uniref:Uncharacterized protein n=1 Tax=Verruconis gallopava TaxID=253628 RepID=A0A0D2A2T6_9PEZI|nr:uncharacterized protein PV09_07567 [Verruconis gallopava]KIW01053.1 hypothetical protein PV09_07567 [Verruconis gallopava]
MQRRGTPDSRSPTIAQTPSRNVPIRSTESHPRPSMEHLLDGLRMKMLEDREKQDELFDAVTRISIELGRIKERQDDYWDQIKQALDCDSRTSEQEANNNNNSNSTNNGVDAISEAGDSVLGRTRERSNITIAEGRALASVISAPNVESHSNRDSVHYHVDNMIDAMNSIDTDDGTAQEVAYERQLRSAWSCDGAFSFIYAACSRSDKFHANARLFDEGSNHTSKQREA